MKDSVLTPVGIEQSILALRLTNQTAPEPPTCVPKFLCNVGSEYRPGEGEIIGEPQPTPHCTVEHLRTQGIVGLYRGGRL